MYPKFNLYNVYDQCNHMYAPKYFDWVKDGSGELNFWVDDYIVQQPHIDNYGKPNIAMLIEPRTIQPTIYKYVDQHYSDFDIIFSHDMDILKYPNAYPIYFMNWYKTYDVPKTKAISMVCSDKGMCEEHQQRRRLADTISSDYPIIDHYGRYLGDHYCDYYECRAEYMFEVVVDNNWSGYWLSEKLANPLASKTIPIYLGGKYFPDDIDLNGIIRVDSTDEMLKVIDRIVQNPNKEYNSRIEAVNHNYETIQKYQVFEDWFYTEYKGLLENVWNKYNQ